MNGATNEVVDEFPFVEALAKKEKSKIVKIWDHFQEVREKFRKHGLMITVRMAASLLGISYQRVQQLVEAGKLEHHIVNGHIMVTEDTVVSYANSERKAGRPCNTPGTKAEWRKRSKELVKAG